MHLQNVGRRKRWATILAVLMLIGGEAFAKGRSISNASALDALAHIEALSRSSEGTIDVYYDFVENGKLQGGKVAIEAPSTASELFLEAPLYNAYTLIDNGPSENRIDLVCVGDGYTSEDMDLYLTHIENVLEQFFNEEPLKEYANYFNVHVVEVISNQSGVDEPGLGIYRNTALDMAFDCQGIDRLLCVDYTKAWTAAGNARDTDLVLVFANTTRYGGAGYSKLSTLAGGNVAAVEVALHEFGHSFANLADEYHYYDGTTYTGNEPTESNVSKYNAAAQLASHLKWYLWLNLPEVDTFEGAKYKQYGIYRPTDISKMMALDYPFGPINVEQFVFNIYQAISSIDSSTPAADGVLSGEDVFSVIGQVPATHTLRVEWQIDGTTVLDSNQISFCPDMYLPPNTTHILKARVTDDTALVRDENKRITLLTDERSWQIRKVSADFNTDGIVDLADFSAMSLHWLETYQPGAACWKLDETTGLSAMDSSGNNHNGTLINGPMWTTSGQLNGALQFDGLNDYVKIAGYQGITGIASRTCTAWIKTSGTAQNSVILSWGGDKWIVGLFSTGELTVYAGGPYIKTTKLLNDNQWHHVVAVMTNDGSPNVSEINLYVDGLLQTTANSPGDINTPQANDVFIGAFSTGSPANFFKGLIDDVRIYDGALSDEQIAEAFIATGDFDKNYTVDIADLFVFCSHWLEVVVPNVTGMSQSEAQAAMVAASLAVGTIAQDYHATIPLGNVISSEPVAGTKVNPGSAVNLLISTGFPTHVPNFTGMPQAAAEAASVAAGLVVGTLTEECSDTVAAGNIISQNPPAGEEFLPGATVNLVISKGAAPSIVWVSINDSGAGMKDGSGNPISHGGFTGEMSRYETTNAQYCQYLNAAKASKKITVYNKVVYATSDTSHSQPYYNLAGAGYTGSGATNGGAARINNISDSFIVDSGFENHPVTYVSWYGSSAFCNYYGYRLPTEWEWQAVADYDGSYNYGCGIDINNSIANYYGSTHPNGTTAVGAFGTYGYGMCDMAGNVWEWTSTDDSGYRILRGGSWRVSPGRYCKVSNQFDGPPNYLDYDSGFRVCR